VIDEMGCRVRHARAEHELYAATLQRARSPARAAAAKVCRELALDVLTTAISSARKNQGTCGVEAISAAARAAPRSRA
jgi:hypothetical protein